MKLKVYLGGWAEEKEYRKEVTKKYNDKFILLDPMTISHLEVIEKIGINEYDTYIVRRDKKMILESDILVVYMKVGPTFGSVMEIMFAYNNGIPVYIIDPTEGMKYASNAWVKFHTKKSFSNIDDCFNYMLV